MVFKYIVTAIMCTAAFGLFAFSEEELAEYLKIYDAVLVEADTHQTNSSFTNDGHWSPKAVPQAGKTYYVPSGMRITDPGSSSRPTFPGTLALAGYVQAMCSGGYKLTFNPLRMLNGSEYRWSSFNTLSGDVYIDSDASDPARFAVFYHSSANCVTIGASFHGDETRVVEFGRLDKPKTDSWIPGVRYSFIGKLNDYHGTLLITTNALFEANGDSTGNAKIKVGYDGYFSVCRAQGTLTVRSLELGEGAHLCASSTYELTRDTAPIYITEELKIGENVKIDGFAKYAKITASNYRLALFELSDAAFAKGVKLPENIALPSEFFGFLPKNPRLEILDNQKGGKSVYIVYDPQIAIVKHKDSSVNGVGAFTAGNDDYWDPVGIPDSGTNADIVVGASSVLWGAGSASWPNASFLLQSGTAAYIQNNSLLVNMHLCPGSSIMSYGNGNALTLNGTLTVYPGAKSSSYTIFHNKNIHIHSEIAGDGDFKFNFWNTGGGFHLYGVNDRFGGNLAFGVDWENCNDPDSNVSRVYLYDSRNLGGTYTGSAAWKSISFDDGLTLVVGERDITLNEPTRGVAVNGNVEFAVAGGKTLAIKNQLTFNGILTKTGEGMLSLGGPARFIDGNATTPPALDINRLTVAEGELKVCSTNALDGVQTEFAEGTSLVLDVAPAAGGMAERGVVGTKWATPFTAEDAITVKFEDPTDALASRPVRLSTAVCTVSAAAAGSLEFKFARVRGYRVSQRRRENGDGTLTVVADFEPKGMMMMLR